LFFTKDEGPVASHVEEGDYQEEEMGDVRDEDFLGDEP